MVGTTRSQVIPLMSLEVILYLESIPRLIPNSFDFANCSAFSIIEEPTIRMEPDFEVFGGVCVCCPLVFEFSVGIGGFVIGLGQISFFFSAKLGIC